ncbi:hypothetical protein QTP88_022118 [Uroleucon formosanum]
MPSNIRSIDYHYTTISVYVSVIDSSNNNNNNIYRFVRKIKKNILNDVQVVESVTFRSRRFIALYFIVSMLLIYYQGGILRILVLYSSVFVFNCFTGYPHIVYLTLVYIDKPNLFCNPSLTHVGRAVIDPKPNFSKGPFALPCHTPIRGNGSKRQLRITIDWKYNEVYNVQMKIDDLLT